MKLSRRVPQAALVLAGAAMANAALWRGGLDRAGWNASVILIALAALLAALGPRLEIPSAPLGFLRWPLLALPAYALVQMPFSVSPAATGEHVLRLAACSLAFVTARASVIRNRATNRSIWFCAAPLLFLGGSEALLTLAQPIGPAPTIVPHGTYDSRNHLAGLLEMVFPFAAMYAAARLSRARAKGFSVRGALKFCAAATLTLVVVAGQLRSLSRMGLVSLLAAAIVMAGLSLIRARPRGWMNAAALAALLGVTLWLLFPPLLMERMAHLSGQDMSVDERVRILRESLPLLRDYPILGCGLGGFATAFARYRDPRLSFADYAHNDYLQYLMELGPLVWSLAFFSTGLVVLRIFRYAAHSHRREKQFLAIGAAAGLSALLVHSAADYNLYIPANALVFAWTGGIAAGLTAVGRIREGPLPTAVESTCG